MILDIIIVVLVAATIARNLDKGFMRQFWMVAGFFIGALQGRILADYTVGLAHTTDARALVTLVTIIGCGLIGLAIGEVVGFHLKNHLLSKRYNVIDDALGVILSVFSILISIWLMAAIITSLPSSRFKNEVNSSKIITGLDDILPAAPNLISELGKIIDPNGFPNVFVGSEPIPRGDVNIPALGSLINQVNADKNSVVRVEGLGCGGIVTGSGFVVGNGLVVTNAHVVAGISNPYVEDVNGKHLGKVVWFDPNLDLAVMRTTNLGGKPLTLNNNTVPANSPAAVLGYPGGGQFMADPAAVTNQFQAQGNNIYGNRNVVRGIIEVQSTVIPGNSGGPLIDKDGQVIGVVFAESTSYKQVGYALAMPKVISEINQARNDYNLVSTGKCAN